MEKQQAPPGGPEKGLYVRLPWPLWQAVDRLCRKEKVPKTEIVVYALRRYLEQRGGV